MFASFRILTGAPTQSPSVPAGAKEVGEPERV